MSEGLSGVVGLAFFLLHLAFALGLFAWARRVARARPSPLLRAAVALPIAGFAASQLGGVVTVVLLVRAFEAVADAPPAEKAMILAARISEAMTPTAIGLGVAIVSYVASAVVSSVGGARGRA